MQEDFEKGSREVEEEGTNSSPPYTNLKDIYIVMHLFESDKDQDEQGDTQKKTKSNEHSEKVSKGQDNPKQKGISKEGAKVNKDQVKKVIPIALILPKTSRGQVDTNLGKK